MEAMLESTNGSLGYTRIVSLRDRIASLFEECQTRGGLFHPNVASWECDWLLTWRDREPLQLDGFEIDRLCAIEQAVLGKVR